MKETRRKSYISIIIVVGFIALLAYICIQYDLKHERVVKKVISGEYSTIFKEEDEMQYEYSNLNSELKNLRAFAIKDNYVVGVKDTGITTNIIEIDPSITYDYVYDDAKLYLLEKENGRISVIPLKTASGTDYVSTEVIELGRQVKQIQVCDGVIYYLADGKLFKLTDEGNKPIYENIEGESFIIQLNQLYIIKEGDFLKVDLDSKEETVISNNVSNFNYYNYYESNKIVFETCLDGQNSFKNILDVYDGTVSNSINNNGYFVVYEADEYIYVNNDKTNVFIIEKNGNNKVLYDANSEIKDVVFIKEGFIIVETEDKKVIVNLDTRKVDGNFDADIDNIKYIK